MITNITNTTETMESQRLVSLEMMAWTKQSKLQKMVKLLIRVLQSILRHLLREQCLWQIEWIKHILEASFLKHTSKAVNNLCHLRLQLTNNWVKLPTHLEILFIQFYYHLVCQYFCTLWFSKKSKDLFRTWK